MSQIHSKNTKNTLKTHNKPYTKLHKFDTRQFDKFLHLNM